MGPFNLSRVTALAMLLSLTPTVDSANNLASVSHRLGRFGGIVSQSLRSWKGGSLPRRRGDVCGSVRAMGASRPPERRRAEIYEKSWEWFNPVVKYQLDEAEHLSLNREDQGADVSSKPLLVYVPGIDGSGLTPLAQFAELSRYYEVVCMGFQGKDRSTFNDIRERVANRISNAKSENRTVYLMGESFGGTVALSIAMGDPKALQTPDRLILINSASCFDRTFLGRISPALINLPEPFFSLAVMPVAFTIFDTDMFSNIAKIARGDYPEILASQARQEFVARLYPKLLQKMLLSSNDLKWRVQNWILPGCAEVNSRLREIQIPVLAVAGTSDLLLPSEEEANRFKDEIPNCRVELIKGAGHAGVIDHRTDLRALIHRWLLE
ncbi:hypothetical protein AAMO2058_000764300 [Amorphochlora amoebiformis]